MNICFVGCEVVIELVYVSSPWARGGARGVTNGAVGGARRLGAAPLRARRAAPSP